MAVLHDSDRPGLLEDHGDIRGEHSLPVLRDWKDWWGKWGPLVMEQYGRCGWVLFMLDAVEKILETQMTVSRLIRGKPEWDTTGWSEREWLNVADVTADASAWFDRNCPRLSDLPEWAGFVLAGQRGMFRTLARIGRELRSLQEQGYTTVVLESGADGISVLKGGDKVLKEVAA